MRLDDFSLITLLISSFTYQDFYEGISEVSAKINLCGIPLVAFIT